MGLETIGDEYQISLKEGAKALFFILFFLLRSHMPCILQGMSLYPLETKCEKS